MVSYIVALKKGTSVLLLNRRRSYAYQVKIECSFMACCCLLTQISPQKKTSHIRRIMLSWITQQTEPFFPVDAKWGINFRRRLFVFWETAYYVGMDTGL